MARESVGDRITARRAVLGLSREELAAAVGVGVTTVQRWENDENVPKGANLANLLRLLGVTKDELLNGGESNVVPLQMQVLPRKFRVVGCVQAGEWREALEWPYDDQYDSVVSIPGLPNFPIQAYEVRGTSMDRHYPDGSTVYVVSTIANRIKPRNGQRVLVNRRDKFGMYEATLKELFIDEDGHKWLWPRSKDPLHQTPILLQNNDTEEVTITGVVVAAAISEAL